MSEGRIPEYQINNLQSDGYGRIVQTINGKYYDGYGNYLSDVGMPDPIVGATGIGATGPQGIRGEKGDQGIPGISPTLPTLSEVFTQNVPATIWSITHSLNKKPSVTILDSAGTEVCGSIEYISNTMIEVQFNVAFSGMALLN